MSEPNIHRRVISFYPNPSIGKIVYVLECGHRVVDNMSPIEGGGFLIFRSSSCPRCESESIKSNPESNQGHRVLNKGGQFGGGDG